MKSRVTLLVFELCLLAACGDDATRGRISITLSGSEDACADELESARLSLFSERGDLESACVSIDQPNSIAALSTDLKDSMLSLGEVTAGPATLFLTAFDKRGCERDERMLCGFAELDVGGDETVDIPVACEPSPAYDACAMKLTSIR
jgi:hypothetical protein